MISYRIQHCCAKRMENAGVAYRSESLGCPTYECSNSHRSPDRECGQNAEGWRRLSYNVFRSAVEMLSSTLRKRIQLYLTIYPPCRMI